MNAVVLMSAFFAGVCATCALVAAIERKWSAATIALMGALIEVLFGFLAVAR